MIGLSPRYASSHGLSGNDSNAALEDLKTSVASDSEFHASHFLLGHALFARGKAEEALAEFRRCLDYSFDGAIPE